MLVIEILLSIIGVYLACGFVFAIAFLTGKGINSIDDSAHGSTTGFKILISPGVIVFWALLLRKWMRAKKEKHHD